jgi:hypothetical protein
MLAFGLVVIGVVLATRPDPVTPAPSASEPLAIGRADPVEVSPTAVSPTVVEVPAPSDTPLQEPNETPEETVAAPAPSGRASRRSRPNDENDEERPRPPTRPQNDENDEERPRAPTPVGVIEPRPLDTSTWMRVLPTREAQLDACYFAHYTSPPRPRISTQATVHVSMNGAVESASVAGAPAQLGRCLEGELRRLRFPSHPWPSRGSFRLTLFDNP